MKIKLTTAAYAEGRLCEAGETVDVPAAISAEFGIPLIDPKLSKKDLQALCEERMIEFTADDNKDELLARLNA